MTKQSIPAHILPIIVVAQFAGTALWFAGNGIAADLQQAFGLPPGSVGHLTSAVQLGFIAGTFLFALLAVADRFSPAKVFLFSALAGAAANLCLYAVADDLASLLAFRFATGFFLAGVYPVGMKIAADWHEQGLGKALGYLVGALVLGTAFPHLLQASATGLPWRGILVALSALSACGGLLLYLMVPDGPFRKPAPRFDLAAISRIFRYPDFRTAAFGYFGHMWEVYAFWAFVPAMLATHNQLHSNTIDVPFWAFWAIAAGSAGCVAGGYWSLRFGSPRVAVGMLAVSTLCCVLSPVFFWAPSWVFLPFLLLWGFAVVGDSPQFSAMVARTAPPAHTGTALTISTCIGFGITIGSIQLLTNLAHWVPDDKWYLFLAPGPLLGLFVMRRFVGKKTLAPFSDKFAAKPSD